MKIMLIGLPRSGTTIISNYINSLEESVILIEPHLQYYKHHDKSFLNDFKLKNKTFPFISYFSRTPLDKIFSKLEPHYKIIGFKETFRCQSFGMYDRKLPNEKLLAAYRDKGYRIIPIYRDPLMVWNSLQRRSPKIKEHWSQNVHLFIENFSSFFCLTSGMKCVIYENFIDDPKGEISRALDKLIEPVSNFKTRDTMMGDETANSSLCVEKINRPRFYSEDSAKKIVSSEAYGQYIDIVRDMLIGN